MNEFLLINSLFLLTGLIFMAIGLPLIMGKVKPNRWYGFRTRKTLSNTRVWYPANKVMGYDILLAGIVMAIAATILLLIGQRLDVSTSAAINLIVMLITLGLAVAHSFAVLRKL